MAQKNMQSNHKSTMVNEAVKIQRQNIEDAIKKARQDSLFKEKIARGKCRISLLADNTKEGIPKEFILKLRDEIEDLGFLCFLGSKIYELMRGSFNKNTEAEIEKSSLILIINGVRPGTVGESKKIRIEEEWKKKSLFFFKYENYEELTQYALNKEFPIDFRFPIPYKENEELKAKVLFGTLHWHYYKYRNHDKMYNEGKDDEQQS